MCTLSVCVYISLSNGGSPDSQNSRLGFDVHKTAVVRVIPNSSSTHNETLTNENIGRESESREMGDIYRFGVELFFKFFYPENE